MALGKGLGALIQTSAPQKTAVSTKKQNKETEKEESSVMSNPLVEAAEEVIESSKEEDTVVLEDDVLRNVPLSQIESNPEQPRSEFEENALKELASSIKEHGVLQPILVTEKDDGTYQIIAGERRVRAANIAGLATIPAMVRKVGKKEKLELALVENVQRRDLNPIEEAHAYCRLRDEFSLTYVEMSKRIGRPKETIKNTVRLLDLPQEIKRGLVDGKISMPRARTLLSFGSVRQQLKLYHDHIKGVSSSIVDLEHQARKTNKNTFRDPWVDSMVEKLRDSYGTKVHITNRKGKGHIKFEYYSNEELKRMVDRMLLNIE